MLLAMSTYHQGLLFLPDMASVRISQMNDDFKFSKENQLFLVAASPAPLLISNMESFRYKKRPRKENRAPKKYILHAIHDCSPLQQVAMAEKVGASNWED
jgi:hypothetical protein